MKEWLLILTGVSVLTFAQTREVDKIPQWSSPKFLEKLEHNIVSVSFTNEYDSSQHRFFMSELFPRSEIYLAPAHGFMEITETEISGKSLIVIENINLKDFKICFLNDYINTDMVLVMKKTESCPEILKRGYDTLSQVSSKTHHYYIVSSFERLHINVLPFKAESEEMQGTINTSLPLAVPGMSGSMLLKENKSSGTLTLEGILTDIESRYNASGERELQGINYYPVKRMFENFSTNSSSWEEKDLNQFIIDNKEVVTTKEDPISLKGSGGP